MNPLRVSRLSDRQNNNNIAYQPSNDSMSRSVTEGELDSSITQKNAKKGGEADKFFDYGPPNMMVKHKTDGGSALTMNFEKDGEDHS